MEKKEILAQWHSLEKKWQNYWSEEKSFRATNPGDPDHDPQQKKFYCLDMFPYPSGQGLHVGHPLGYIASDIISRYKRMKNCNVLHPMGWDAFGLPAEQYAIQKGVHPSISTQENIQTFKRQLNSMGISYDWEREINSSSPEYLHWTQWIFLKLFENDLAYEDNADVNWCPELGTVLANDEIIDGKSERGGFPVIKKPMRQWMLKITAYAEKLLADLDDLDWPESTKEHQRNWIGKSVGAELSFQIKGHDEKINVFTTRADTLFGVSFLALAPEHPLLDELSTPEKKKEIETYKKLSAAKSDLQRGDLNKNKSGVFTGATALHPITGKEIPIWCADYVLMGYGSGAIMAVPAHDERDLEFAEKYSLEVLSVNDGEKIINSEHATLNINGQNISQAQKSVITFLENEKLGNAKTTYRLRDWIFSRQRYWGEAIPILHTENSTEKVAESELPLTLPEVKSYLPTGSGESPIAAVESWIQTTTTDGTPAKRESNTMPGSAASSWYFLRYMDPKNKTRFCSVEAEKYWGQVDLYIGGAEHAVGHLLYSRFWQKFLFDQGLVSHKEPFKKLIHQGMILAENGEKMSKRKGNVVNPDKVIEEYGADTLRIYEMFLGPIEKSKPWQTSNIEGSYRFLAKLWKLVISEDGQSLHENVVDADESQWPEKIKKLLHKSIHLIEKDIEKLSMNTAVSKLMILLNEATSAFERKIPKSFLSTYTLMLAPFAPHIAEEIWKLLGNEKSLVRENWPTHNPKFLQEDEIQLIIQVNGKLRDKILVSSDKSEDAIKELALNLEKIKAFTDGKEIKKVIYVKNKLVSIAV